MVWAIVTIMVMAIAAPVDAKGKKSGKQSKYGKAARQTSRVTRRPAPLPPTPLLTADWFKMQREKEAIEAERARRADIIAKLHAELDAFSYPARPPKPTPIDRAAGRGDIDRIREWINEGHKVDDQDIVGRTPMHWAAVSGQEQAIRLLISEGAKLDIRDRMGGMTPLHYAAEHGKGDVVRLLVESGADIHARDDDGNTPLDLAQRHTREDVIAYLRTVTPRRE